MNPVRIHSTVTHRTLKGWGWGCQDCHAKADGYDDKDQALRVASIHEDPSREHQGSAAAATKNRTKPMKKTLTTLALGAALLTGLVGCGTGKANEAVANAPRPTVTVTAPAKPAPTVTTTVNVPTVPQACLDALTSAEQGFDLAAQGFTAASNFDVATMNAVTEKLGKLAPTWNANKAACRAAGGN